MLEFDSQLDVLRHNHRQVEEEHGVDRYRKESCTDLREDIAMLKLYLDEKLGSSRAECRRATTYSKMTETDLNPLKVGWAVMVTKEQELRDWLQNMIDKGEFGAVGDAPPNLAAELGLTEAEMTAMLDADDTGGGMGGIEIEHDVETEDANDGDMEPPINDEADAGEAATILVPEPMQAPQEPQAVAERVSARARVGDDDDGSEAGENMDDSDESYHESYVVEGPSKNVTVHERCLPVIPNPPNVRYSSGFDSSSDDDVPLSMRLPKKKCSLPKSVSPIDPDPVRTAPPVPAQTIVTSGGSGMVLGGDSDSDDDVPLSQRMRMIAKKWVEKNKINKSLDKDADAYVERVLKLLGAGEDNRRSLRSKKSDSAAGSRGLNVVAVATEARLYYSRVTEQRERRPKKILSHEDYPSLGRYYLCLWSDVGYAGQDREEMKPPDYVMQFDGLLEDYRKVHR